MKKKCSRKNAFSALIIILVVFLLVGVYLSLPAFANRDSVRKFFDNNREILDGLIETSKGKILFCEDLDLKDRIAFFRSGLNYIDGRNEANLTAFGFDSENIEGELRLCYAPDGDGELINYINRLVENDICEIPASGVYIEGLGMGQKGYISCEMLDSNWYLIDIYLPT